MTFLKAKRLLVIPSCPFAAYEAKGTSWWLERYYNPAAAFGDVHAFSPFEAGRRDAYGMTIHGAPKSDFQEVLRSIRPDVVRAYGGFWPARLALTRTPSEIPVVVSVHDTRPQFARPFVRFADMVLCVSKAVKQRVLQCGASDDRLRILPNRVDLEIFFPRPAEQIEPLRQRFSSQKTILFVGRLDPQKNLDTVIRALRFLPGDYHLIIIGPGDATVYQQLAEQCGVNDRCHWQGAISNKELAKWYSFCSCFCAPSRAEGFGVVFAEAAACGAAIVTSDIAPMNEILADSRSAILVADFEKPRTLAHAVEMACANIDLCRQIRDGAIAASKKYSQERIEELETQYYQEVLQSPRRRSKMVPWQVSTSKALFSMNRLVGRLAKVS